MIIKHEANLNVVTGDFAVEQKKFTDDDVRTFSRLCGDQNPIHLNEEYASKTRFKSRIVHGIFVASMFSKLCADHFPGCIYMKQDLKFIAPVYLDEQIEGKIEIKEVNREKKRISLETSVKKIGEGKFAIQGEALVYYEKL